MKSDKNISYKKAYENVKKEKLWAYLQLWVYMYVLIK